MAFLTIGVSEMQDSWSIIESNHNGSALIIRLRQNIDATTHLTHVHRITVIWSVIHAKNNGFPVKMEQLEMESFEDNLIKSVEQDNQSTLSLVYTGSGVREWIFYTKCVEEFSVRLNAIPQQEEKYPIEIYCEEDHDWALYDEEYKRLIGQKPN